jgi:predicted TIM-barrel fold metal-dependent hydrolase
MIIDFAVYPPFKSFMPEPRGERATFMKNYDRIYGESIKMKEEYADNIDKFFEELDDANIGKIFVKARDIESTHGLKITNEACADLVKRYPDRMIGMAGVDPFKGHAAVEELEHAVKELGLVGVQFWPFEYDIYPNDRRYYPFYEKCVELDIPVSIESSMHFARSVRMDLCRPLYHDYVAVDFPELKMIMSTPGWPWVGELIGVAWRHPNVYIATSVVRMKYIGMPNTGYEMLLQFGNSILQDKIIYGTGWPNLPFKRNIEELKLLPLKERVKEKWLGENVAKLFRIDY